MRLKEILSQIYKEVLDKFKIKNIFSLGDFYMADKRAFNVAYVKDEDGYTNVRSGKGTQYSIIGKYKDGASIFVHPDDFSKSWMRVYHDNGTFYGYMSRNKIVR